MIVCITEKPSVARDIASILKATTRRDGYFEGNGYRVTWTFGHLCCLKEPADYSSTWKAWSIGALPMIPQPFGIKLIAERGIEHQFEIIKKLVSEADQVINCGDAGQEGELIQRWVLQMAEVKCPVRRLWISSLTDEAIRKGFEELRPEKDYDNLYHAGLSRAIGDWILGINSTRLYTIKYSRSKGNVLSVGRVQTPTLAMIVSRHFEILNFKPEEYFELHTIYRDVNFSSSVGKITDRAKAEEVLARVKDYLFIVTDVSDKKGREAPLRLFDLTGLQVECNKRWGWSADESLRLIQSLYEKKVTTYPRVDTTYLPSDVYSKIPGILSRMTPYSNITAPILAGKLPKSKKIFDDSKVTDHHAIIPTGERPSGLVGNERQMYHLIAMRFIAAFYPDCIFNTTTVMGRANDIEFKATGKIIVEQGWRALFSKEESQRGDEDNTTMLPPFVVGENGPHEPCLVTKNTQPPKQYTEGTLLRAMETAGKNVDEEELREAMKENGIGRPSTRASIIETLFKRRYIRRERKNIVATDAGIALIDTIRDEILKSPKLTGLWENKLRRIERGTYSASDFITELKVMVDGIVRNVISDNSAYSISIPNEEPTKRDPRKKAATTKSDSRRKDVKSESPRSRIKSFEDIKCPVCGIGHIIRGRNAFGCNRYASGCKFVIPFSECGEKITPSRLAKYISKTNNTK